MTEKELNRDSKRLLKKVIDFGTDENYYKKNWEKFESEVKSEWKRLYGASNNLKYGNKKTILILLRINLRFRFEALHHFGIGLNLKDI